MEHWSLYTPSRSSRQKATCHRISWVIDSRSVSSAVGKRSRSRSSGSRTPRLPALGGLWLPPDLIAPRYADFTFNLAKITPEKLNDALLGLSTLPLVLTFDISFFDSILTRLITQFSALPILVGLLSLGAAAVITANTVALATLDAAGRPESCAQSG